MTSILSTGGAGGYSGIGASLDLLNAQNTAISAAISTGVNSDSYAGLGDQRYQALSLQPQITQVAAWQQNVTTAQSDLALSQTALTQIASIATSLETSLTSLQSDTSASTIGAAAKQAALGLSQLASLANTEGGTGYVFGGTYADTPPVSDPSNIMSSTLVQSIAASVATVATNGAQITQAATVAAASDNTAGQSVFSAALSTDAQTAAASSRSVIVGTGQRVTSGFVLTQGCAASGSSTGSSIRDLIRELAVVAALPTADSSSSGYADLITDTASSVDATSQSLIQTQSQLGQDQDVLSSQATTLTSVSTALANQLGSAKNSDPTALSTLLANNKDQLTASYTLIADMKGLSLASYL